MTAGPTPAGLEPRAAPEPVVDPRSGEIIPDTLETLLEAEEAVDRELRALGPMYRFRDRLRARIAEHRGPAALPPPRSRTDKQDRVSKCPRCGDHSLGEPS